MKTRAAIALLFLCACKEDITPVEGRADPETLATWNKLVPELRVDRLSFEHRIADRDVRLAPMARRGAPSVLAFWATYCPPCIAELPMFSALARSGHMIVGVSVDAGNEAQVAEVLASHRVHYPQAILTHDSLRSAGRALDGVPFTIVLDPAGGVVETFAGRVNERTVVDALARAARSPAPP
jgi:thiol-disulfide isomerase/thioredoxin